ncbi:hypothetical protein [Streptomyces eurythermus]|uniref:hypothetical protein n=1 Tax=Streptomyces eurythermus TaxID=42237 RepID=UPI0036F5A5CA
MPSTDTATAPFGPPQGDHDGVRARVAQRTPEFRGRRRRVPGLADERHRDLLQAGEEYADARQQGSDGGCGLLRALRRATRRAAFETAVTFDGPGQ